MLPDRFHSFETQEPFVTCLTCDQNLNTLEAPYTVSKIFRRGECVMEYAMCMPCRQGVARDFSEESQRTLEAFFDDKVNLAQRSLALEENESLEDWTKSCLVCKSLQNEETGYSLAAMAYRDTMIFDPFPMMVCGNCEEEIQGKLSKTTRERWNRFVGENFPGPPATADTPTGGVPVLI